MMPAFELFVDDNYHYMDEGSRYKAGVFATYDEALAKAKAIVDDFLTDAYRAGMTSQELYAGYTEFGEDPFIVPAGDPQFSAWDYARERSAELCRDEDAAASVLRYAAWPPELGGFDEVLVAGLRRSDLNADARDALIAFRLAVDRYPNAMPRAGRWYWLRVERGEAAFTAYLHADRFKLSAHDALPAPVEWELRFCGSGQLDRREGDVQAALTAMAQAAGDPAWAVRVRA